jgi:hypothetical protein
LAVTLLDLGHRTGRVLPTGVEIEATNEQLGSLADISCFTASRLLKEWERGGAISKVREKVVIHTPEALATEQTGNSMLGSVFLAGVAFTFSAVQQRQAGSVYLNLIRQAFPKCVQQDSRLLGNQEALLEKTDSCFG